MKTHSLEATLLSQQLCLWSLFSLSSHVKRLCVLVASHGHFWTYFSAPWRVTKALSVTRWHPPTSLPLSPTQDFGTWCTFSVWAPRLALLRCDFHPHGLCIPHSGLSGSWPLFLHWPFLPNMHHLLFHKHLGSFPHQGLLLHNSYFSIPLADFDSLPLCSLV